MVADESAQASPKLPQTFASKNCTELSYRITMPTGKFNVESFAEEIGGIETNGLNSTILDSRNRKRDDYHIHVFWEPDDDDPSRTKLQVDYHAWPPEFAENEKHPVSAEHFFDWVSQYFNGTSVNAHIHAEFEYPAEKWQSRLMLLPIRVPFDDKLAVIDGFSVSLPLEPQGVNQVWVAWNKKRLTLQVFANRAVHFKGFTPHEDIDALRAVIKKLIGEKEKES